MPAWLWRVSDNAGNVEGATLEFAGARRMPRQAYFGDGGDSVLVIKLVARIRRKLGVELTPGDVFDHPGVAALSALLASRQSA